MKAYIKPTSEIINLIPENMLAKSGDTPQPNDEYSGNDMYSNKKGWDSSQWSNEEE
ncbi:MAG: hypothetical protein Q4E59_00230 [Bacteroidales bacterium]|nr:hypothetical protein [Bacteroidales bacterium]